MTQLVLVAILAVVSAAPAAPVSQAPDYGAQLRAAASLGDLETVTALLDGGEVDVDAANEFGATPLIVACLRGNVETVSLLLERGADPDRADTFYKRTPLGWASVGGAADVVSLLFDKGAEGYDELLQAAIAAADIERARYLLQLHLPTEQTLGQALEVAITMRNEELFELLREFGAERPPPPPPLVVEVEAEYLRRLEGAYVDEVGFALNVVADVDARVLLIRPPGIRNALRFVPVGNDRFQSEQAGDVYVVFNVRGAEVLGMSFTQGGFTRRLMRQ